MADVSRGVYRSGVVRDLHGLTPIIVDAWRARATLRVPHGALDWPPARGGSPGEATLPTPQLPPWGGVAVDINSPNPAPRATLRRDALGPVLAEGDGWIVAGLVGLPRTALVVREDVSADALPHLGSLRVTWTQRIPADAWSEALAALDGGEATDAPAEASSAKQTTAEAARELGVPREVLDNLARARLDIPGGPIRTGTGGKRHHYLWPTGARLETWVTTAQARPIPPPAEAPAMPRRKSPRKPPAATQTEPTSLRAFARQLAGKDE